MQIPSPSKPKMSLLLESADLACLGDLGGDAAAALSVADDALVQARNLGGVPAQIPLLQRLRGAALARTCDRAAAQEALDQSLNAARERGAEYEVALTSLVMAEVQTNLSGADELRRTAEATLAKRGVVSAPDLCGARSRRRRRA